MLSLMLLIPILRLMLLILALQDLGASECMSAIVGSYGYITPGVVKEDSPSFHVLDDISEHILLYSFLSYIKCFSKERAGICSRDRLDEKQYSFNEFSSQQQLSQAVSFLLYSGEDNQFG